MTMYFFGSKTILLLLATLAALIATSSCVSAQSVRGAVASKPNDIAETGENIVSGRHLKEDSDSEEMSVEDEEGEDVMSDRFTTTEFGNVVPIFDEDEEDGDGLIERSPCEPDPQVALDFVLSYGQQDLGDEDCLADPVNGCDGGCCRMGVYFICDTDRFAPHLPCVCNSLTQVPPTQPPVSAAIDSPSTPPLDPTLPDIVDTAVGAGSFNTLVDLVATAGLVTTLKSPGPFTVFAPSDAAFPTGVALEEFKNSTSLEDLTKILTYHVVPGIIRSTDLVDGAMVTTVQGKPLTVNLTMGAMVNDANIVQADIETSNGIIHVIDSILMPPGPDIVETAIAAGNFTTLVDLVATAGLVETLQGPGPFTVFAPIDSAFPSGQDLEVFKNETDLATLSAILTYHVIPGVEIMSTDLVDGAMVATVQGSMVEISLDPEAGAMVNDATIIAADIQTSNGVIHIIDAILMPDLGGLDDVDVDIARSP